MCISDWRIGRFIRSAGTQNTIGISATVPFPANPARVGLVFGITAPSITITVNCSIQFNGVILFGLGPNVLHAEMWFPQYGDLLRQAFTVVGGSSAFNLGITEFMLPEAIIQAPLEAFYNPMVY